MTTGLIFTGLLICGCTPSVRVLPPEEPIEINMNLRIDQEVQVKVAEDARSQNMARNLGIFDTPPVMP